MYFIVGGLKNVFLLSLIMVVIKGKEVYYPSITGFALPSIGKTKLSSKLGSTFSCQNDSATSLSCLLSSCLPFLLKAQDSFVQPQLSCSLPVPSRLFSKWFPPSLVAPSNLPTVFYLYSNTSVLVSPRKCSLDPDALSSCCYIFFFLYCQTSIFQISSLISAAHFFPWYILKSGFHS